MFFSGGMRGYSYPLNILKTSQEKNTADRRGSGNILPRVNEKDCTFLVFFPPAELSWSCNTYITAHSPTLMFLHLHHSSFSNPSVALPTSQLILLPFRCFTYVTAHTPTLPLLHLHHSSFSNPSIASPTSQFIL